MAHPIAHPMAHILPLTMVDKGNRFIAAVMSTRAVLPPRPPC
jgi:hypothetical protein